MNDSSYWGPPRHDLPMTHATPNPTDSYHDPGNGGGQADWSAPVAGGSASSSPSSYAGGTASAHSGGPAAFRSIGPRKRSLPLAAVLALLLGPLGLFYVSLLNGIAALIVLPFVVRSLAFAVAALRGGGMDTVYAVAVPILWCIAIPWAIVGVKVRNARIDRAAARSNP